MYHGCRNAFPKFEFMLDCLTDHVNPDGQVCWGARGKIKIAGKAGNDGVRAMSSVWRGEA